MPGKVNYSEVPDTPLGYLANKMSDLVPEGTRAMVLLSDEETNACMTHTDGYNEAIDPQWTLLTDLAMHVDAMCQTFGIPAPALMAALALLEERRRG